MRNFATWKLLLVVALIAGACNGDGAADDTGSSVGTVAEGVSNACPADGCRITIVDVTSEGDELAITWEANFAPDASRNHIHVYWDTFTAEQVSSDAEAQGTTQGEWVPTDAYPRFVTESEVSVANRGESTTVCVTAGNRDHAVLDSAIFDCRDVSGQL